MKELMVVVTGAPNSGKTSVASLLQQALWEHGVHSHIEDWDAAIDDPRVLNDRMKALSGNARIYIKVENRGREPLHVQAGL